MKVALLFLVLAPAQAAQQFDLECSAPMEHPSSSMTQAHAHFRFDLASNKWCEGDCGQVHPIQEVQPTVIYLDHSPPNTPAAFLHYRQIDRQTGEYIYASPYTFEGATCAKQPFSGFPKFDTKF